jgi:hypothetical protein
VNARQLLKLFLLLGLSSAACYGVLKLSGGSAVQVFEEILTAFFVVATVLSAMSVGMFTYIDNIARDLTEHRNDVNKASFALVQERLTSLKREVLYNGALIVLFFVFERSVKAVAINLVTQLSPEHAGIVIELTIPLRSALFIASLWAAGSQLKGFLTAAEFRDVISKNRK